MEADGGDDEPHILGILPAEDHDTADQLAAAALIHQGDQAVTELHLDGVHGKQPVHIIDILVVVGLAGHRGHIGLGRRLGLDHFRGLLPLQPAAHQVAEHRQAHAHHQQGSRRGARDNAQDNQHSARGEDGPRLPGKLLNHIGVQAALRHRPGNDHTGSGGDHQGRKLGHKAVADGGDGVGLGHSSQVAHTVHATDDDAAD